MVLCRVIMGRMEVLPHGSNQSFPSSNCYDSGVDDLENPRQYVVWNMNMNTHIYPEVVVSFKASSRTEGDLFHEPIVSLLFPFIISFSIFFSFYSSLLENFEQ